jgi:oxaloacetate decarboxylase beta subunit
MKTFPWGFPEMLLTNMPMNTLMKPPEAEQPGGLLWYLYQGLELRIYPPLIFLGVGRLRPSDCQSQDAALGGSYPQVGIFFTFIGAVLMGFPLHWAAPIGGADGPTAIYLTSLLAPELLGSIATYSHMALVPIIQPPMMRLLTSKKERRGSDGVAAAGKQKREDCFSPSL